MTAKLLITASSTLALVGAIGGVSYIYSKKEASNGSKVSKSKIDPIFDLEAYKTELSNNRTLQDFFKDVIKGKEIEFSKLNSALESIKNSKIKDFFKKILPPDQAKFDNFKTLLKNAFKTKDTQIFHSGIKNYLENLLTSNSELKEFFNKTTELFVGETFESLKNHPLSKGTWLIAFPTDADITMAENKTCRIRVAITAETCHFYDINLDITKSNHAFTDFPNLYNNGFNTYKTNFTGLNNLAKKYSTENSTAWTEMRRKPNNQEISATNLIEWYQNGHKFIKDNWESILSGITIPGNNTSNWTIKTTIKEIEDNIKKIDDFKDLSNPLITGKLSKSKAYLVHLPGTPTSSETIIDYSSYVNSFYKTFTGIDMETRKNSPHYIQSAHIVMDSKTISAIPINSPIVKAIQTDIQRIKDGHFSWLLTLGVLWYVEGLKMIPHVQIAKINPTPIS